MPNTIFSKLLYGYIRKEKGAIGVMFALLFPSVIVFYSMAFDSAVILSGRARLADGLNQGIYAVAIQDNRNSSEELLLENKAVLNKYVTFYLPKATIDNKDLTIKADVKYNKNIVSYIDYSVAGKVVVHPIVAPSAKENGYAGFSRDVDITADSNAGVVRRTMTYDASNSTDYVFVVDFSTSMTSASSEAGLTRIQLLKKVVNEFSNEVLKENESTKIGIVPFSWGVAVQMDEKNEAGGKYMGCTFAGKLLDEYKDVDLNFWYNKNYSGMSATSVNAQQYNHDVQLYNYYNSYVTKATSLSMQNLVTKGWCEKNEDSSSTTGRALYSCDYDQRSRLFDHTTEFTNRRTVAYKFFTGIVDSIVNSTNIDYAGTLNEGFLFSDAAVTTFKVHPLSSVRPISTSSYACGSMSPTLSTTNLGALAKPKHYLIDLTSDLGVLDEFSLMTPAGSTDSNSGLLRAVPLIAKGTNPRKIIMVISDGEDNAGPVKLTDGLHKTNRVCDKIKSGLLKYPEGTKTEESDIYFISVVDNAKYINYWADNCTGKANSLLAKDYKTLLETLLRIAQKGSVSYINKNEE